MFSRKQEVEDDMKCGVGIPVFSIQQFTFIPKFWYCFLIYLSLIKSQLPSLICWYSPNMKWCIHHTWKKRWERYKWQVCSFVTIVKVTHHSLTERSISVIWVLCFLAELKQSFRNKETRWIKWDPNINENQKPTLFLLNNQAQQSTLFFTKQKAILHGFYTSPL